MASPHPLRQYRESKGLSQAELASLLGVAPNTVWRWEAGEREPSRSKRREIERKTGLRFLTMTDKREAAQ